MLEIFQGSACTPFKIDILGKLPSHQFHTVKYRSLNMLQVSPALKQHSGQHGQAGWLLLHYLLTG